MNYLKNEYKKVLSIKAILIYLSVLFLWNIFYISLNPSVNSNNWRDKAIETKDEDLEFINSYSDKKKSTLEESLIKNAKDEIEIIDYSLENNIIFGIASIWNYTENLLKSSLLLIIIITYFSSKIISLEYENKTWKNLILTNSSRYNIIISKYKYFVIQTFFLIYLFVLLSLILAGIVYGNWSSIYVVKKLNNSIVVILILKKVVLSYFLILLKSLFYGIVVISLNIITKNSKISLILALILVIFNGSLSLLFRNTVINKILPFTYLTYTVNSFNNILDIILPSIILFAYMISLIIISIIVFNKRDI